MTNLAFGGEQEAREFWGKLPTPPPLNQTLPLCVIEVLKMLVFTVALSCPVCIRPRSPNLDLQTMSILPTCTLFTYTNTQKMCCVSLCVCVCVRERERKRERESTHHAGHLDGRERSDLVEVLAGVTRRQKTVSPRHRTETYIHVYTCGGRKEGSRGLTKGTFNVRI